MKIAVLASLLRSISPTSSGGTEVFTSMLTQGLLKSGIDVTLFATSDTQTQAKLEAICSSQQTSEMIDGTIATSLPFEVLQARNAILRSAEFDVIHNNYWHFYLPTSFAHFSERSIVTTIHNNFWHYPALKKILIDTHRKDKDVVVFLSKMAQSLAGDALHSVVIPNGIDQHAFPFSPSSEDYVLWFSRLVPAKGIEHALQAAKLGKFKLQAAGALPIKPDNKKYVDERILPLFVDNCSYVGRPDALQRVSLYQNAKAFLFPALMDEQFPLVVLEAMSCGTPIIAYNRGAISDEVEDGVTGFLIDPDDEPRPGKGSWIIKKQGIAGLVEAVDRIAEIDRVACRAHVEAHFTRDKMIARYIDLYLTMAQSN